jgi:hypothetical protein
MLCLGQSHPEKKYLKLKAEQHFERVLSPQSKVLQASAARAMISAHAAAT